MKKTIANMSVRIGADTKQFTKSMNRMKGSVSKMQQSFARMRKAAMGALAGYASISFLKKAISAYDQQEKSVKALSVALGSSTKALEAQASALQKQTRFGDESILQGQAYLAQMKLQEESIRRITPYILDFAEAQGMNVADAFKLVAKTLGSSTNALSRYGLTIEGAVGSNERLDSAVNALSSSFGGQARAAAEVGSGSLAQLGNWIGDLTEKVGGFIMHGLAPLASWFMRTVKGSSEVSDALVAERSEVELIMRSIASLNEGNSTRAGLIDELNAKYPDILKNYDAEKITNGEILTILKDINTQYERKIELAILEEEGNEVLRNSIELAKKQRADVKEITRLYELYIKEKKEDATLEEKVAALKTQSAYDEMAALKDKTIASSYFENGQERAYTVEQRRAIAFEKYSSIAASRLDDINERQAELNDLQDKHTGIIGEIFNAQERLNKVLGKQIELLEKRHRYLRDPGRGTAGTTHVKNGELVKKGDVMDRAAPAIDWGAQPTPSLQGTEASTRAVTGLANAVSGLSLALDDSEKSMVSFGQALQYSLQGAAMQLSEIMADTVTALMQGTADWGDILKGLLSVVADFLENLGKALIASALAAQAFKKLLANPYVAIAAGIAAMALAGVVRGFLSEGPKLAKGGLAYGPTMAMVGDNPGARSDPEVIAPLSKLNDYMSGGNMQVSVTGRLRGTDIYLLMEKYNQRLDQYK